MPLPRWLSILLGVLLGLWLGYVCTQVPLGHALTMFNGSPPIGTVGVVTNSTAGTGSSSVGASGVLQAATGQGGLAPYGGAGPCVGDNQAVVALTPSGQAVCAPVGGASSAAHFLTTQSESGLSNEVSLGGVPAGLLFTQAAGGVATVTSVPKPAGDLMGTTQPQRTTNTGVDPRRCPAQNTANTLTFDLNGCDILTVADLQQPATVANPTGSGVPGQLARFEICSATSRALTWGSQWVSDALPLPTVTRGGGQCDLLLFQFEGNTSQLHLVLNVDAFAHLCPSGVLTPGSYTNTNLTVNGQGCITAVSTGTGGGPGPAGNPAGGLGDVQLNGGTGFAADPGRFTYDVRSHTLFDQQTMSGLGYGVVNLADARGRKGVLFPSALSRARAWALPDTDGTLCTTSSCGGGTLTIQEIDGTPTGTPSVLKFSNGSVTNNGDGSFTVVTGGTGGGDVSSDTTTTSDGQVALFKGTGGKTITPAGVAFTGMAKLTSGVLSVASNVTDYQTPLNTSAGLAAALSDELGTGRVVFETNTTLNNPSINKIANLTSNGCVQTSGGDGTLSVAACGGAGTPSGTSGQVQYNNAGAFGGSSGLTLSSTAITGQQTRSTLMTANLSPLTAADGPIIECATTGTNLTATLPAAASVTSLAEWTLVKVDANASTCILAPNGTDTLNGVNASVVAATRWSYVHVRLNNAKTGWLYDAGKTVIDLTTDVTGVLPVANGGTGLAAGTSGGLLAYTATGTLASSGVLSANNPVLGGGAGAVPVSGTRSGNTTAFVTKDASTPGANDCAKWDASGNLTTAGAACGTGGVAPTRAMNTSAPLTGGGDLSADRTLACPTCTTNAAALTANQLVLGGGGQTTQALGSAGTTTQVLHGNAAGAPTFGAVALTADVTGRLPYANLVAPSTTSLLLGRGTTAGDFQEITLGTNLSMSGTTLNASAGAGGYATVQDEGGVLNQRSVLNFTGAGVTCVDNAGATRTDCTISGSGQAYSTVQEESGPLTQRGTLNFVGAALTAADNAGQNRTDVTLSQSPSASTSVVGIGRTLTTSAPLGGGGDLSADRTLTCTTCTTNSAALTANQLVLGSGGQATVALGSLGTTTTVLHGNAAGAPTFGAVSLTADVSGTLPVASGGTNLTTAADDTLMVGNGTTWQSKALTLCDDTAGKHLNYDTATNTFSCGTSTSGVSFTNSAGLATALNDETGSSGGGLAVFNQSPTLVTPIIASGGFSNANHTHASAAQGGQLTDAALSSAVTVAKGGTGLTTGTTGGVLYFSSTSAAAASAALTANQLVLGGGATGPVPLGSLGTTTTVLHGNAAGAPSFGAVSLTADVSGRLPYANIVAPSAASKLFGRGDTAGDWQEISLGTGLTMTGTTLAASGGVPSSRTITTTAPLGGGGDLSADRTLTCTTCTTNAAVLTANQLVIGAGGQASAALGSLGTTTTVLHGNAAGAPTFGAVSLTADVTGALPRANGGLNSTSAGTGLLRDGTTPAASELSGDATTSGSNAVTVGKVNGVAYPASPATDSCPVITAANTATYKVIPDCDDTGGQHLNYDQTTHAFSCGTSGGGVGTPCTPAGATTQVMFNNAGTTAGSSGLTLSTSQILSYNNRVTSMTGNITISAADGPIIACTSGASALVATLPAATSTSQSLLRLVKIDAGAGTCAFARSGSDTLNNAATSLSVANRDEYLQATVTSSSNWEVTTKKLSVSLTADVSGRLPYANIVAPTAASKLFGRGDTTGDWQEISLGTNLTMSGSTLNAAGGSVSFATAGETTTGTETAKAVTPDGLAGSDFGKRYITLECVPDATDLTTGTGKCFVPLHQDFNGWNFVGASAHVGSVAGATSTINVDVQRCGAVATGVRCSGTNVSVFSTILTIDAGEDGTETAATAAVVNAANQALATGQWLRVDVAGTFTGPPKGLYVTMVLQKP